jgi:TPP-dependent pyruvate/acetoin dehydrogenase alpha subunit
VDAWKKHCPIATLKARLLAEGALTEAQVTQYAADIEQEMQAAVAFAQASPWEPAADLERFVYAGRNSGGAA